MHVEPREKYFIYSNRNHIQHYGEYSNTPLEGTNYGLKHSSISTHPGLSMDNSMVILSIQPDKHMKVINGKVLRQNKKECLNYIEKVHSKLTNMASSIISNMMAMISKYDTVRTSVEEWRVKNKVLSSTHKSLIPEFDVLSTVFFC